MRPTPGRAHPRRRAHQGRRRGRQSMLESKNIAAADDKRTFEHGEVSLVHLTGFTLGRADFRPGWRWSTDVKPVVGTDSCQGTHISYVVSGRFHVRMDDGRELELGRATLTWSGPATTPGWSATSPA